MADVPRHIITLIEEIRQAAEFGSTEQWDKLIELNLRLLNTIDISW